MHFLFSLRVYHTQSFLSHLENCKPDFNSGGSQLKVRTKRTLAGRQFEATISENGITENGTSLQTVYVSKRYKFQSRRDLFVASS